ncbi:hypothetical protein ACFLYA_02455 [Candidatus Dependentiae bacterium]
MELRGKNIATFFIFATLALGSCTSHAMIKKIKKSVMSQKQKNKMLFEHCRKGNLQGVKDAIEIGADIHALDPSAVKKRKYHLMTILEFAIFHDQEQIAEYLASKINPYIIATKILKYDNIEFFHLLEKIGLDNFTKKLNFAPYSGLSMLGAAFLAFKNYHLCNQYQIVDYLVSKNVPMYGNKDDYLFRAARDNNLNVVKYLIEHGADVKAKNKNCKVNGVDNAEGLSALDIFLQRAWYHGTRYTKKLDVAEHLIKKGALLYDKNRHYLYDAFQNCQTNIFNYVIKNGAKISQNMLKQLKETNEHVKDTLEPEETKAQEEMLQYYEKLVKNHKPIMIIKELNQIQGYKNDIKHLIKRCNETHTSAYSIQIALPIITETYLKSPEIISKNTLKDLYKKIPFNHRFMNEDYFKHARICATKENIRDINGLTIDQACMLYGKNTEGVEQIISNKFPVTTAWRQINKNQLMDLVGKKKNIGQNSKYHQNFVNMAYVNCLLNNEWKIGESKKVNMPAEVSSQIASYLDHESLKEIVMEKK